MPIANSYNNTSNVTTVVPSTGPIIVNQAQTSSTSTVAPAARKTVVATTSASKLTAPSPTPPITPGSATGTNPVATGPIVPDSPNLSVPRSAIPEAVPTPQITIPTPANTVVGPSGFINIQAITVPNANANSNTTNVTNIYNTYYSNIAVYDESTEITGAVTELRFQGDGVAVSGSGIAYIDIPGGISGIMVQDEGTMILNSTSTINFVGSGVTASNVGGVATITVTSGGITGIAVQDEGTNVVASANKINFVGNGVVASNVGGTATVTITSSGIQGIAVQDEGANILTTANAINFVGAGVTASNVGNVATITIAGGGGSSGIAVQDEGTNVVANANTINFVGNGVAASNVGGVPTVTITNPGFAVQDEGTNVVASANIINFVGNGVAASNVSGVPTVTITSGGIQGIAVQDEGTNVVATANTINFVGNAVVASNVGGVPTVTITSGGIQGITVQEEGTNVLTTANTINFVGSSVTASNVGNVATITISGGGNTSNIANGTSNVNVSSSGGNVTTSVNGNANILVVTGTGANINGYANISGNLSAGNLSIGNMSSNLIPNANVTYNIGNASYRWKDLYLSESTIYLGPTATLSAGAMTNGNSNVAIPDANGNINMSVAGNANVVIFTGTGANIRGYANITGNVALSGGNISLGSISNLHIAGGTNGYVLQTDGAGNLSWTAQTGGGGGNGTPGGTNTQVQFNNAGNFAGNTGFTFDSTVGQLSVPGNVVVGNATGGNLTGANVIFANSFVSNGGNVDFSTNNPNVKLGNVANVHISGGSANYVLTTDGAGNLSWSVGGGGATVAGSNTQVQFNDEGALGANANLTFDKTNGNLTVGSNVVAVNFIGSGANTPTVQSGTNLDIIANAGVRVPSNISMTGANVSLGAVGNLHITGGVGGQVLRTDGTGNLSWVNPSSGGNGTPGGTDTQLQYNNAGEFGADGNLVYDYSNSNVWIGNVDNPWIDPVQGKAAGNLMVRGMISVGSTQYGNGTDTEATIRMLDTTSAYGFTTLSAGILAIVNEEASYNQAMILGDSCKGNSETIFGISTFPGGNGVLSTGQPPEVWSPVLDVRGDNLFVSVISQASTANALFYNPNTGRISYGLAGGFTVQDEGANVVTSANRINFVGNGVVASNVGGVATITIPGNDGNGNPGGANTQVQYNDDGIFGGNPGFTFDEGNTLVTANNFVATSTANLGDVANVTILGGSANLVLTTDGTGNLSWSNGSAIANVAAGGANTQVQYNDDGILGGNPAFTFDEGTTLITANNLTVTSITNLGIVSNVHIDGGNNGYYLQTDGAGGLTWAPGSNYSGNGTVAGANTQIQFNDEGNFGAVAGFTFDKVSTIFTANNIVATSTANLGDVANVTITGGNANFVLTTDGTGVLSWTDGGSISNVAAGGANTQVQYNDDGILGGNPAFTFDEGTTVVTANNLTVTSITRLGEVANVHIDGGNANFVLTTDGTGNLTWANLSTTANIGAGGANTQVQYNDNGILGGNPAFTFDEGTTVITANNLTVSSITRLGAVGNVHITGGNNGYFLQTDGTGNLTWAPASANSNANSQVAGANTQIQFNDAGNFGAAAGFTFDKTTTTFTANNIVGSSTVNFLTTSNVSLGAVANVHILGGNANFVLTTDGTGNLSWSNASSISNIKAGGSNTQVQYNDNGILGGNPAFTFDEALSLITANNFVATSTANLGDVANVTITGGTNGYVLQTDGSGNLTWTAQTGSSNANAVAAGANTQIQFNDEGTFGAVAGFTFDKANTVFTANNIVATSTANLGNVANVHILGGNANFVLTTNGSGNLTWSNVSGLSNIKAGGANTQVQYNDNGILGGNPAFTFDESLSLITANNFAATSTANLGDVANIYIGGGNANFVLTTDGAGTLTWANVSNVGNVKAGGANTQIQYNDNGILGGNPAFTFDEGLSLVTANNLTVSSETNLGDLGNVHITGGNPLDVIATIDGNGALGWATIITNEAAGANTQVQYNDDGILGGNPTFTFDEVLTLLTVNNFTVSSTANLGAVANVHITGGNANYVLTTDGAGNLSWGPGGGNSTPGGSNTQIQYNDNGVFSGDSAFTFDEGNTLVTANNLTVTSLTKLGAVGNVQINGGTNGYVLTTDGAGHLSWTTKTGPAGNGIAGGADTQVQYNDAGDFGGNPTFTFNEGTTTLTANNFVVTSTANLGAVGNVTITGGNSGQYLTTDGNGVLSWAAGGVGTPGGSNTQMQFNDNGSFGGSPTVTYADVFGGRYLTISGNSTSDAAIVYEFGDPANVAVTGVASSEGNIFVAGYAGGGRSKIAIEPGVNGNITMALGSAGGTIQLGVVDSIEILGGTTGQVLTTLGDGNLYWSTATGSGSNINVYNGLDFIVNSSDLYLNGPLVTVADVFDTAQATIGLTVKDEGNTVGASQGFGTLNFTGAGVTVTQSGTTATVNIPGGGGSSSVSAPYIRTYTGNAIIGVNYLFDWYPIPLDNNAIVNNIGAVDQINGVTYLSAGTYYFESTVYINCSGSDTIQDAYACLIENPSISLDSIPGTDPDNYAPYGNVLAKAGVARIGDWSTTPLMGLGTFTIATDTYVSLAIGATSGPRALMVGDEHNLGYNTTVLKLWKTA